MNSGISVKFQIWPRLPPHLGQSDRSILKSRYLVNFAISREFFYFFATSYISVTSKQWIEEFWSKFKFHPSLGQSGRSILKSRYLVNPWSDFSNFLQRVTFPSPRSNELTHFGQNTNLTPDYRLSRPIRSLNSEIAISPQPLVRFFNSFANELHFRDL